MVDRALATTWVVWAYPEGERYSGTFHRTSAQALTAYDISVDVVSPVGLFPFEPLRSHTKSRWPSPSPNEAFIDDGLVRIARPEYLAYPGQVRVGIPDIVMERRINAIARPTDLVHAHGAYPWGLAGLRLARRWDVPFVLTLHGSDVNKYPQSSRLSRSRFNRVVAGADQVIAVSAPLADATLRLAGVRPLVLPIGVLTNAFGNGDRAESRDLLGLPKAGKIVLYVGNLEAFKGIGLLLSAAALFVEKGITLAIAGDGSMRSQVQRCGDVRYLGPLPADSVPTAMAASDALVLPSFREGLPTVVCEAGISGLPVVASRAGGLEELLAGDRGYILEQLTPNSIFETTYLAVSDSAESARRAQLLKSHVETYFDVTINALKLADVYRDCL